MKFLSTRGKDKIENSFDTILKGIAADGGLFVPEEIPSLNIEKLLGKNYIELANEVIGTIFNDIEKDDLSDAIKRAYHKFGNKILDIKTIGNVNFLELYHGPTAAFKDFALCLLPQLMMLSLKNKNMNKKVVILTATSGDTGKAALEGFKDVEGIDVIVFYPTDGVSSIQKYQMITQEGQNTHAVGIKGNFDDAQSALKNIFLDKDFSLELDKNGFALSSANSINIGRLVPQIVYYIYAYLDLVKENRIKIGDKVNVCVPTGNFGNILAAYLAKQMGTPIDKLICASNENDVLTKFFNSGKYDANRNLKVTTSPSMDIIVSSNLERLLYFVSKGNSNLISNLMEDLKTNKFYEVSEELKSNLDDFYAYEISDSKGMEIIKNIFDNNNYLIDTHTAVGYGAYTNYVAETGDDKPVIIASTASPYKFPLWVSKSINVDKIENEFALINEINNITKMEIPTNLKDLDKKRITQNLVIDKNEIKNSIANILKVGDWLIKVRVPATSANLGPGFDSMGVAFNLYNDFIFKKGKSDEDYSENLIYQSMEKLFKKVGYEHDGIIIEVNGEIPQSRGLGSSAACIIGGLIGANELSGNKLSQEEILELATEIEGHPDNVAPALYGGLVASVMNKDKIFIDKMKVSDNYKFILLIPDFQLSTQVARDVLPESIPFEDAVFNISRSILLTKALENGDFNMLCGTKDDRLHQPYRRNLVYGFDEFEKVADMNCGAMFLSGAGPTILVIAENNNENILTELIKESKKMENNWKILELKPDNSGAYVI